MTDAPGVWYMVMAAQAHQVILTTCSNRTTFPVRLDLYAEADQGRVKVLFASSDATYGCAVLSAWLPKPGKYWLHLTEAPGSLAPSSAARKFELAYVPSMGPLLASLPCNPNASRRPTLPPH